MKPLPWLLLFALLALPFSNALTPVTACGTLSKASETYILQNDVSAAKTCFKITASGITLDLGGKTVTFDNAVPVNQPNAGFESGTVNWDFSNAPNAQVVTTGQFPAAKGSWAPAEIQTHALKFTAPSTAQYVYSDWIRLEDNDNYMLSALIVRPVNYKGIIVASLEDQNGNSCNAADNSWPDLTHWSADNCLLTSRTSQYVRVKLGVSGGVGSNDVYFDAIQVVRGSTPNRIIEHMYSDSNTYGVYIAGGLQNVRVTNGNIVQGQSKSVYAAGIQSQYSNQRTEIDHINMVMSGSDNWGFFLVQSVSYAKIHHNTITINGKRTHYGHEAVGGAILL
ncbi:MAG: hypothetical protein ABIG96_06995, partial [Candidatus Micrarchaeota archaeon]